MFDSGNLPLVYEWVITKDRAVVLGQLKNAAHQVLDFVNREWSVEARWLTSCLNEINHVFDSATDTIRITHWWLRGEHVVLSKFGDRSMFLFSVRENNSSMSFPIFVCRLITEQCLLVQISVHEEWPCWSLRRCLVSFTCFFLVRLLPVCLWPIIIGAQRNLSLAHMQRAFSFFIYSPTEKKHSLFLLLWNAWWYPSKHNDILKRNENTDRWMHTVLFQLYDAKIHHTLQKLEWLSCR